MNCVGGRRKGEGFRSDHPYDCRGAWLTCTIFCRQQLVDEIRAQEQSVIFRALEVHGAQFSLL
jgi:hypothetical protein